MRQGRRRTYSIAAAGLALTIFSLCQHVYVDANEQFESPSTSTIQKDERNLDSPLPAPMYNKEAFQETPDGGRSSSSSPDLTEEDSGTAAIPEAVDRTVGSAATGTVTVTATPKTIPGGTVTATESKGSTAPDVESEDKSAKSRATEDSVVNDDADVPSPKEVESEETLVLVKESVVSDDADEASSKSEEVEDEAPSTLDEGHPGEQVDEETVPGEGKESKEPVAHKASSKSEEVEGEAANMLDEGHPEEKVGEETVPGEVKESKEPVDQKPKVHKEAPDEDPSFIDLDEEEVAKETVPGEVKESKKPVDHTPKVHKEEPDDDPSFIDLDEVDSSDSLPEEKSIPPKKNEPPLVDAHTTEQTISEDEPEEIILGEADVYNPLEDDRPDRDKAPETKTDDLGESMQKGTSESAAVDAEKLSQPKSGSSSNQDKESVVKADAPISNEKDEIMQKGTSEKTAADAEKPSPPKAGSLASFFEKVSSEQDTGKAADTMTKATKMSVAGAGKKEEVLEDEAHVPSCGVWGAHTGRRYADLSVLFLLFQDYFMSESDDKGALPKTKMDKADMASIMTDEILRQGQQALLETPEVSETAEATKPKSVNHEFVEGLDDIDKLFEGVDPPDELDVGAAGSSIQEVLMGQGARILLKRISIGAQLVKKTSISLKNKGVVRFRSVKDKAVERFENKDFKVTLPEKEEAIRAAKQAAQWVWTSSQHVFHTLQAVLDDMLEGEDIDDMEFDVPPAPGSQKGATSGGTPEQAGKDDEMEEFLRQWRGSEANR
jgi:hypothetical protein